MENTTVEQIIAEEAAERVAFEAQQTFKGFTIADLRVAFDRVQHSQNWKLGLAGIIPVTDIEKIRTAVEFFAGSPLTVEYTEPVIEGREQMCFVKGPGYYACVGA